MGSQGRLERQIKQVPEEIKRWPEWMRREAGIGQIQEPNKPSVARKDDNVRHKK